MTSNVRRPELLLDGRTSGTFPRSLLLGCFRLASLRRPPRRLASFSAGGGDDDPTDFSDVGIGNDSVDTGAALLQDNAVAVVASLESPTRLPNSP
jgi:hypothetical protein